MSIFSSGATLALRPGLHCFVRFRERHPQRPFVGTICRDDGNFTFGKFQRSAFPDSVASPRQLLLSLLLLESAVSSHKSGGFPGASEDQNTSMEGRAPDTATHASEFTFDLL